MLNERTPATVAPGPAGESPTPDSGSGHKVVYWHRELPPLVADHWRA